MAANSTMSFSRQQPQDLDFLINELRFPTSETTVQRVLGYLYHYVPYVKQEHNLRLVIASFLNNPICFGQRPPTFRENYLIVEVFKLIAERKLKVSQPSLAVKSWYGIVEKELSNFVAYNPQQNSWKVVPILAGLMLANDLRDDLYTKINFIEYLWFFRDFDAKTGALFDKCLQLSLSETISDDIVNLSLLSFAVVFRKDERADAHTGNISGQLLARKLAHLLYSPHPYSVAVYEEFFKVPLSDAIRSKEIIDQTVLQQPVVKHLNKLAFLLESYLQSLDFSQTSFDTVLDILERMLLFNQQLARQTQESAFNWNPAKNDEGNNPVAQQYWLFLKQLLFSEVVVFQGILSRFLHARETSPVFLFWGRNDGMRVLETEYREISVKILNNLYYLNFILLSIGQGGFDLYNFVYYLALEILLKNNHDSAFERWSKYLIGNYTEINLHPNALNANYVMRCKVLFVLGLWENYLQTSSHNNSPFTQEIYHMCYDLVGNSQISDLDIIEAGHSVLLIYFSTSKSRNARFEESLKYVDLLLRQFPAVLSANQLSIAVETIGKKVLSLSVQYAPETLRFQNSTDEFLNFLYERFSVVASGIPIASQPKTSFTSAQPIAEIDASSTLSQINDKKTGPSTDIVEANKLKKPKDYYGMTLVNTGLGKGKDYKFANRVVPETAREAVFVSFVNLFPYLPLLVFQPWLERIWVQICQSDLSERHFLTEKLWQVLSKNLDFNRGDIAFRWWYNQLQAVDFAEQMANMKL